MAALGGRRSATSSATLPVPGRKPSSMSCGALVIGSNTEPVTEVIKDKKNGLLVDFFDDKKLSLLVTKVLKNVDNYQHIKENARDTIVKNYDLRTICLPQQLSMIEEALK